MTWNGPEDTRESNQTLWMLAAAPTLWAVHFLASYITGAVWCAKAVQPDAALESVRWVVAAYTFVALAGILATGWLGFRRYRYGGPPRRHHQDTPADRHRFLGFATLLLAGMSAVAVLFVALVPLFFETCR